MLLITYKRLLLGKLIAVLIGGGLLLFPWLYQTTRSAPTGSVVLLVDGAASFVDQQSTGSRDLRLFTHLLDTVTSRYTHTPVGLIYGGTSPTYLLPDSRERTRLTTTIRQLIALQQPSSHHDRAATFSYLGSHATTGSTILIVSDPAITLPPTSSTQSIRDRNLTIQLLVINPADQQTVRLTQARSSIANGGVHSISTPSAIDQLPVPAPGSRHQEVPTRRLLLALFLILLGL